MTQPDVTPERAGLSHTRWEVDMAETLESLEPLERVPLGKCDNCRSANALTLWEHEDHPGRQLTFCLHCAKVNGPALKDKGWQRTYVNMAGLE